MRRSRISPGIVESTSRRTARPWRSSRSWRSTDFSMSPASGAATTPAWRVTRKVAQAWISSAGNSSARLAVTTCSTGTTWTPLPPGRGRTRTNRGTIGGSSTDPSRPPSSLKITATFNERLAGGGSRFSGFDHQRHQHGQDSVPEPGRHRLPVVVLQLAPIAQLHTGRAQLVMQPLESPALPHQQALDPLPDYLPCEPVSWKNSSTNRPTSASTRSRSDTGHRRLRRARADDRRCPGCRRPHRGSSTAQRPASLPRADATGDVTGIRSDILTHVTCR